MRHLPEKLDSKLDRTSCELVKDLFYVGSHLRAARKNHEHIEDVIDDINNQKLGFELKTKQKAVLEDTQVAPMLVALGVDETMVKDHRIAPKFSISIKGEASKGICIDGDHNFRDGRTNTNWAVYKSIKNGAGEIVSAAIYVPNSNIIYVANEKRAYTIELGKKPDAGKISEFKIAPVLRRPFTAEYASWHKVRYSIAKAIFSTLVRENIGGSIRESGMDQLPLIWAANGERGLAVLNNVKPDADKTGAFIAQKAGAAVVEIPITTDPEGRSSLFSMHPDIEEKVLGYFDQAMKLSHGFIMPGNTQVYGKERSVQVMAK